MSQPKRILILQTWTRHPAFRLIPNKPDQAYKIGVDRLSFRVTAPPGRGGLLNVVIINSDGTVAQPGIWSKMPIKPGESCPLWRSQGGVRRALVRAPPKPDRR